MREALELYKSGSVSKKSLRDKTKKDRRNFFTRLENFFVAKGWIFSEETANNFITLMSKRQDGTDSKKSSIARYIAQLRAFNSFCIEKGYLTNHFTKWIAKPPEEETLPKPVDIAHDVLLTAIFSGTTAGSGDRSISRDAKNESRAALLFELYTSRRSGEFVKLKGLDIHPEGSDPYYTVELKGGKQKNYPIPENLITMLEERRHKEKVFDVTPEKTIRHLRNGLLEQGISKEIVERVNNHTLRKAFAKEKNRNGEPIQRIASAMGDTVETIETYYLSDDLVAMRETVNNSKDIRPMLPIKKILDDVLRILHNYAGDDRFQIPQLVIEDNCPKIIVELSEKGKKDWRDK